MAMTGERLWYREKGGLDIGERHFTFTREEVMAGEFRLLEDDRTLALSSVPSRISM